MTSEKTEYTLRKGDPNVLGACVQDGGVNFSVFSSHASKMFLLIYECADDTAPQAVLPMNRTGDHWHLFVETLKAGAFYLFSAEGPSDPEAGHRFDDRVALLDPEARMVSGATDQDAPFRKESPTAPPKCVVVGKDDFDWQDDRKPNHPLVESIIYEAHLRGFTAHKNSPVIKHKGTYLGFIEMIPHLKKLGVTAVELLPIMEWYRHTPFINPQNGQKNTNDWGYDTLAYKAPDEALATRHLGQVYEFKLLVRELHKAGIEVILDIVLNHSAESDAKGPTINFRGLDNKVYYLLVPGKPEEYANFTGCGNTVNCNHPVVRKMILSVLRHWVEEFHVDGFRFDLAAVFGIDVDTSVKPNTPLLLEIVADPLLRKVKLIAEPWAIGAYLMGRFPAPFAEWSDRFRDTVRSFVRAEPNLVRELSKVVGGSVDVFGEDGERLPVNFVTAHDGFSLLDLVSYESKHNLANGEENRDGSSHNRSWNCGFEGDVANSDMSEEQKQAIIRLRKKQIKNFFTLLMVSRGAPMILFGDEMGRTNGGNNNTWNQKELNELDWSLLEENEDIFRFVRMMIALRKRHQLGGRGHEPEFRPVVFHGIKPNEPDFSDGTRFLAWELQPFGQDDGQYVYCAANAYWEPVEVELPAGEWLSVVDTCRNSGSDIVDECDAQVVSGSVSVEARSQRVFIRR